MLIFPPPRRSFYCFVSNKKHFEKILLFTSNTAIPLVYFYDFFWKNEKYLKIGSSFLQLLRVEVSLIWLPVMAPTTGIARKKNGEVAKWRNLRNRIERFHLTIRRLSHMKVHYCTVCLDVTIFDITRKWYIRNGGTGGAGVRKLYVYSFFSLQIWFT